MKTTFIISEIILISSALLAFILFARLSEEALMSSQFLFIAAFVMAILYAPIKQTKHSSFFLILLTLISLLTSFALPSKIINYKVSKKIENRDKLAKSLNAVIIEDTAIYKGDKIVGIKFKFIISSSNINNNYKIYPVLELPFLADKHDSIYLSLLRTKECGVVSSNAKCLILGNSDHSSYIQWPPLKMNDELYFNVAPISGDSITWLKRNHKGHFIPPTLYFDGTNKKLPLKISLRANKIRGILFEKNFETKNKYNLLEIYSNLDRQNTIKSLLAQK